MAITEMEVLSLLEVQKLEFEIQRAIDIENERKEINVIKCILKKEICKSDPDTTFDFINSLVVPVQEDRLNRLRSNILGALGVRRYSAMADLNTKTVSMFAVAKVVDSKSNRMEKIFVALACLSFICSQLVMMGYVIFETSFPACYSMADCPFGTYCEMRLEDHSTCADCAGFYNKTQYCEDMCPSQLGDENWKKMDLIEDFDHSELWVKPGTNYTDVMCYGFKHCSNTDLDVDTNFKGHCDFIALNKQKMEVRTWMSIIFLGILWALPICQDIEEAALEEQVLDHYKTRSFSFPCEVVRIALRIRRCFLPFVTTTTTIALIVTDNISAKNIILNFLAITFITESDNILALLFLRKSQQELMENVVEPIEIESLHELEAVVYWCRIQGIGCLFLLLIGLALTLSVVENCDRIEHFFYQLIEFPFFFVLTCQGIYRLCFKKVDETAFLRIINTLQEVSRNFIAYLFPSASFAFLDHFTFRDDRYFEGLSTTEITILAGSIIVFTALSIFRWKHFQEN